MRASLMTRSVDEEQEEELDEDDDEGEDVKKSALLTKYRNYLERFRKQWKILDRAKNDVDRLLQDKLQSHAAQVSLEIIHASASEYMDWVRPAKITYSNQPDLPVDMTRIPAIRKYLRGLPAEYNLKDYERHINTTIPVSSTK